MIAKILIKIGKDIKHNLSIERFDNMIKLNKKVIETNKFPDGTPLLNFQLSHDIFAKGAVINDAESFNSMYFPL